jgi:hypothetical protein
VADLGLSALYLILQLWDFQQSQDFALTNAVADIDFDPANISRDFGVEIHLLIGLELTGNGEGTSQSAMRDRDDGCRSRLRGGSFTIVISDDQEKSYQQKAEKPRNPKDSLTMHGATLLSVRKFGIGIEDKYIPLKGFAITPGSYSIPMFENRPGVPKYIAVKGLKEGWRRTLREVRVVEVPSVKPAEVHSNLVKPECKKQNRLGQNQ